MQEFVTKINAVKLSIGQSGKVFYYQKLHYKNTWTRISKFTYETCLKYNLPIATEVKRDSEGGIIFISYKHEKSASRRERHGKIDEEYIKLDSAKSRENYKQIIKKTLGKDGRYYYYESLDSIEKVEDVYWFRIDKSDFQFILEYYVKYAINIKRNENGEIFYMEYRRPRSSES